MNIRETSDHIVRSLIEAWGYEGFSDEFEGVRPGMDGAEAVHLGPTEQLAMAQAYIQDQGEASFHTILEKHDWDLAASIAQAACFKVLLDGEEDFREVQQEILDIRDELLAKGRYTDVAIVISDPLGYVAHKKEGAVLVSKHELTKREYRGVDGHFDIDVYTLRVAGVDIHFQAEVAETRHEYRGVDGHFDGSQSHR